MKASILTIAASLLPVAMLIAQEPVTTPVQPVDPPTLVDEKFDPLHPYAGESRKGVDTKTLEGKIMAGYQGWFNTPEYGAGLGWTHWARSGSKPFGSGHVTVDPPVNFLFLHSRPACRWISPTRLKRKSLAFKTS